MNSKEKTKFRSTSNWRNWRKYLINKCNKTCQICSSYRTKGLQIHHLDTKNYTVLEEDRYRTLCSRCHKLLEQLLTRKNFDIKEFCDHLTKVYKETKQYEREERDCETIEDPNRSKKKTNRKERNTGEHREVSKAKQRCHKKRCERRTKDNGRKDKGTGRRVLPEIPECPEDT